MEIDQARPSTSPMVRYLERQGYVEEEHDVRGKADLYGYGDAWRTQQIDADIPFTTRLVVRRPVEPTAAARTVVIEPLHPAGDMASAWPRTGREIVRAGLTWIGVTQDVAGLAATKAFDPERYAALDIPYVGLGFDIVAQVATMLRGPDAIVPVDHLLMTGASYSGTFQRTFTGDGFHDRARRPDGGPCMHRFDAETLRRLYGTPAEYRRRFDALMDEVVAGRWVADEDAEHLRSAAADMDF